MSKIKHEVKIDYNYYLRLVAGIKKAEIRFNDRDYQVDDYMAFINPNNLSLYPKEFRITHIHSGLGLQEGYVALSVEMIND